MYISGYPVEAQVDGSDRRDEIPTSVGVFLSVLQTSGPIRDSIELLLYIPFTYRKAGRVWGGSAREYN